MNNQQQNYDENLEEDDNWEVESTCESQIMLRCDTQFVELPDNLISESYNIPNDDLQSVTLPDIDNRVDNFDSFKQAEVDLKLKQMAPLSVKNIPIQSTTNFSTKKSVQLVNHYKEMLEEQQRNYKELQDKYQALQNTINEERNEKSEQLQKLKDQINELEKENSKLQFQNETLQNQYINDNSKDQSYYKEILESKEKYIQEVIKKVEKFESILERKNEQIENLNTQIFQIKNSENEQRAQTDLLQQKLELLNENNFQKINENQANYELCKEQLQEEKRQNDIFRNELIKLKEQNIQLEAAREFDQKQVDNYMQQNQYLKEQIQQSDNQTNEMKRTLEVLKNQLSHDLQNQFKVQDMQNQLMLQQRDQMRDSYIHKEQQRDYIRDSYIQNEQQRDSIKNRYQNQEQDQRKRHMNDLDKGQNKTLKQNTYKNTYMEQDQRNDSLEVNKNSIYQDNNNDNNLSNKRNPYSRTKRGRNRQSKTLLENNFMKQQNIQRQNSQQKTDRRSKVDRIPRRGAPEEITPFKKQNEYTNKELDLQDKTNKIQQLEKERRNINFEYTKLLQSNLKSGAMIRKRKELEKNLKNITKEISGMKNDLRLMRHHNQKYIPNVTPFFSNLFFVQKFKIFSSQVPIILQHYSFQAISFANFIIIDPNPLLRYCLSTTTSSSNATLPPPLENLKSNINLNEATMFQF